MQAPHNGKDIRWAEHPGKELLRLSWPITVSTLSYALMTLADTLFVGQLGPGALTAVGLGGTAAFATLCFCFGMLRGVKILVSQARGAGSNDHGRFVSAGFASAIALSIAALLIAQAVGAALPHITATLESGIAARGYFEIRMLSAPFLLVYVVMREARYGVGDARSPMIASLAANCVNVALDYLLIFVWEFGTDGAAVATVFGHLSELIVLGLLHRWRWTRFARADLKALWRLGIPTGLQFAIEMGSFALLAGILAKMGDLQMAAHQIALQVIHFSFLPAYAIGEACSVMTGEAVGARRESLVLRVAAKALVIASTYSALCTVILVGAGGWLTGVFTTDPELREVTRHLLWIAAIFVVFDGANIVARGALRGVGDVKVPAMVGIITAWVLTPPAAWLLGYVGGLGAVGGWLGLCAEIIIGTGIFWWRLRSGAWAQAAKRARSSACTDEPAPQEMAA